MPKIEIEGICKYFCQETGFCLIHFEEECQLASLRAQRAAHSMEAFRLDQKISKTRPSLILERDLPFLIYRDEIRKYICGARKQGGFVSEEITAAQKVCSQYIEGPTRKVRLRKRRNLLFNIPTI